MALLRLWAVANWIVFMVLFWLGFDYSVGRVGDDDGFGSESYWDYLGIGYL